MTDFTLSTSINRYQVADLMAESDEHCMFILAELARRVDASNLVEYIDHCDADASEVAKFFEDLAESIRAGIEAAEIEASQ